MKSLTLKKIVGSTAATVLALGMAAGVSGVASAAKHAPDTSTTLSAHKVAFQGRITTITPANMSSTPVTPKSVTVVNNEGVTKVFVVSSTTKVLRSGREKNAMNLMAGERVVVLAFAATPTAAISINVLALQVNKVVTFQGWITTITPADTSSTPATAESVTVKNNDGVAKTYTFTSSTKVLLSGTAKEPLTLKSGERVIVRALASSPLAPLTIHVVAAK